jgi:hypothetical protein
MRHKECPAHTLKYAYENTAEGGPLRSFLVAQCMTLPSDNFKSSQELFPHEALIDIVTRFSKLRGSESLSNIKASDFYVAEGEDSSKLSIRALYKWDC